MVQFINVSHIVTAILLSSIIAVASWYVTSQIRLNTIEGRTENNAELQDSVNRLIIELSHTNEAVGANSQNSKEITNRMDAFREESIVGFVSLKSIVVVQESLIKSVNTLNTSVTELKTMMKYREAVVTNTPFTDPNLALN